MSIKKLEGGQYEVDVWPRGRNGKRIRRRFEKKQEAVLFERYALANADKKEWLGASVDRRTLSAVMDSPHTTLLYQASWWLKLGEAI